MAQLPEILEWYSLTPMVNEMKSPRTFLRDAFFGDVETQTTENIVFSVLEGGRETAPFVKRDGEAIMAGGYTEKEYTIGAPNIRIKRPLEAADLIFRRHAGDVIFADGGSVEAAAEREIARQLQRLNELIDNAEEYLCALAIRGTISYTAADEANFTITYPKPAANTVTLTNFWDGASATPMQDSRDAKFIMHDAVSLNPTDVLLGSEATDSFLAADEVRSLLDTKSVNAGNLNLSADVDSQGAMFLGLFAGMRWWSYPSQVTVAGVATDLIRAKYAEFLHRGPAAEMKLYYAAISDLDAMDAGLLATRRFSKSWRQQDPSVHQILVTARPLPVLRRPGAVVSMKVVSG
tara:strand:+ start:5330 stop:6376 length:1047 start_codon:yes stop_codon:yes gene_type:complete